MKIEKLGLSINVFDGTELLEPLIKELRSEIDVVVISFQTKSYCGNFIADEDLNEIVRLREIGLIDHVLEFVPDTTIDNRQEETRKRNESIDFLENLGCSHVLNIDSDEFYNLGDFISAKKYIESNECLITYCTYLNYYKDFEHVLVYPFVTYVPFITSSKFRFKYNHWCIAGASDPTRRYEAYALKEIDEAITKIIPDDILMMHHASWIRKDIRKKLENWSAKSYFSQDHIENAVNCYNNWNKDNTKKAKMLFFSENNELDIIEVNKRCFINLEWL